MTKIKFEEYREGRGQFTEKRTGLWRFFAYVHFFFLSTPALEDGNNFFWPANFLLHVLPSGFLRSLSFFTIRLTRPNEAFLLIRYLRICFVLFVFFSYCRFVSWVLLCCSRLFFVAIPLSVEPTIRLICTVFFSPFFAPFFRSFIYITYIHDYYHCSHFGWCDCIPMAILRCFFLLYIKTLFRSFIVIFRDLMFFIIITSHTEYICSYAPCCRSLYCMRRIIFLWHSLMFDWPCALKRVEKLHFDKYFRNADVHVFFRLDIQPWSPNEDVREVHVPFHFFCFFLWIFQESQRNFSEIKSY